VKVQIFENRRRTQAKKVIVRWLNGLDYRSGAGEQTRQPKIVLFGHSWGASAVVYLARELDRESVPVALTVQVDSVRKHGDDDSVIPANVAEAVNFYQSTGLIHGCSEILAIDPSRTKILGNFHFKYQVEPAACRTYPWYDRLFFKGHTSIECDPRLWDEVEALIESRTASTGPALAEVAAQLPRHSSRQNPMPSNAALARAGRDTLLVNPSPKIQ
jgi:pimeloyl-ACP methyl ester carboxylesterase